MRIFDIAFAQSLTAARDVGIAPVWFVTFTAKDWDTGAAAVVGLWSGDEDITVSVEDPTGGLVSRGYTGGCNLTVEDLMYVADLTDNPVQISISQIAPVAQNIIRGFDLRLAHCEIHATTLNGGALTGPPQLQWVGLVDEGPIQTPAAGGEGSISLTIRSEIMMQLQASNPAKSSDQHQRRRLSTDEFCKYAATIGSRAVQWYQG
ncbi:hypothetical protein [Pseudogemmobacter faecipullorum]|uniref:Uncharacterized protein n=1 Tax=Pseudogemmobacter faecipullorum TaxID=2755041 RepID=A0ABS8CSW9_9RHOB|nr:hypothetical protein [Pseudogemmobacter faecipullorum]MCB5412245.1 hypothetical protein [Pseudogemmobacter faecipullorum]